MAFRRWHDTSTMVTRCGWEAEPCGTVLCSGRGAGAVPQPTPLPPPGAHADGTDPGLIDSDGG